MMEPIRFNHQPRHVVREILTVRLGRALLLLGWIVLLAGCIGRSTTQHPIIDQSTPEATVKNLYKAATAHDTETFRALLDPEDPNLDNLVKGFEELEQRGITYDISELEITIVETSSAMVRIRARFREKLMMKDVLVSDEMTGEELSLVNKQGRWYLLGYGQWPPPGWILPNTVIPYATPGDASP